MGLGCAPNLRPSRFQPDGKASLQFGLEVSDLARRTRIEMATLAYAKAERFPSVPCTNPFAPHCQERGHDHRADEEADQSERLQPTENSDQHQQEG